MPKSEALVFDIKRFAVHDGDGLRTTVFFKGCPLRCRWCQNPEGLEAKRQPVYLKSQCIHCHRCEKAAKAGQLKWKDEKLLLSRESAESFGAIVDACPSGAIRYDSKPWSIDELIEKIREDEVFFRHNGGVTFSGGEPLMQGEFLDEILKACKKEGIRTAIETSSFGDHELVTKIAPSLDRIFCDIKILDPKKHKEATGQDNTLILKNTRWLLSSEEHRDKVIIRTPLIPGYTADDENIAAIASWISEIDPDVKYELLNYNPLAPSKYEMVQKTYRAGNHQPFSEQEMERFRNVTREHGVYNIIEE